MQSQGRAPTANAARYMTQLAKHWSHKFEVTLDEAEAAIALPFGPCRITATSDRIEVTVAAADAETLARAQSVVDGHLARFAHREPELTLIWTS